jgi:hypothetical protein
MLEGDSFNTQTSLEIQADPRGKARSVICLPRLREAANVATRKDRFNRQLPETFLGPNRQKSTNYEKSLRQWSTSL